MPAGLGASGSSVMIGIEGSPNRLEPRGQGTGQGAWEKLQARNEFLLGRASCAARGRANAIGSKPLDPGPQFDFPRPGASVLPQDVQVGSGDGVRVERVVGRVGRFGAGRV